MKKLLIGVLAASLIVALAFVSVVAFAQDNANTDNSTVVEVESDALIAQSAQKPCYTDVDNNGECDNKIDGSCLNLGECVKADSKPCYTDSDNDGVCDNKSDGSCLNLGECKNFGSGNQYGAQNGYGNQHGKHNGNGNHSGRHH